jgi:hypothetical protein
MSNPPSQRRCVQSCLPRIYRDSLAIIAISRQASTRRTAARLPATTHDTNNYYKLAKSLSVTTRIDVLRTEIVRYSAIAISHILILGR